MAIKGGAAVYFEASLSGITVSPETYWRFRLVNCFMNGILGIPQPLKDNLPYQPSKQQTTCRVVCPITSAIDVGYCLDRTQE